MRSEGITALLIFINIKLGLNAINGYHSAMVINHDVVTFFFLNVRPP